METYLSSRIQELQTQIRLIEGDIRELTQISVITPDGYNRLSDLLLARKLKVAALTELHIMQKEFE